MFVNYERIPPELRALDQWVAWRLVAGKKVPINCQTGRNASVSDSGTWATFEEVSRWGRGDGIGFVLTEDDPYVGIDLDDVRDPNTRCRPQPVWRKTRFGRLAQRGSRGDLSNS